MDIINLVLEYSKQTSISNDRCRRGTPEAGPLEARLGPFLEHLIDLAIDPRSALHIRLKRFSSWKPGGGGGNTGFSAISQPISTISLPSRCVTSLRSTSGLPLTGQPSISRSGRSLLPRGSCSGSASCSASSSIPTSTSSSPVLTRPYYLAASGNQLPRVRQLAVARRARPGTGQSRRTGFSTAKSRQRLNQTLQNAATPPQLQSIMQIQQQQQHMQSQHLLPPQLQLHQQQQPPQHLTQQPVYSSHYQPAAAEQQLTSLVQTQTSESHLLSGHAPSMHLQSTVLTMPYQPTGSLSQSQQQQQQHSQQFLLSTLASDTQAHQPMDTIVGDSSTE
ncbi:unnamed protein product [Protopolystoma xenopodis]|uniref:Uncharacterized protein n=1 Tax=Protopolystoma xenopodis TaxID=117903 RepID=A0A3S5AP39_9PLAT|nr:unnamed protein product [Protopolystoma xenopodis]